MQLAIFFHLRQATGILGSIACTRNAKTSKKQIGSLRRVSDNFTATSQSLQRLRKTKPCCSSLCNVAYKILTKAKILQCIWAVSRQFHSDYSVKAKISHCG